MKIIFLILTVCLTAPAFSQQKSKLSFGIKAGAAISNLSPDFADEMSSTRTDFRYKTGITVGGRVQIEAGKNFLLMPELSLSGKGAKRFVDYGSGFTSMSPALSTCAEATFNMLIKLSSKQGKFLLGGGPSFAVLLDEYRELLSTTDAGINILAAYQLPIGFSFELNFNKGIKKHNGNIYSVHGRELTTSQFGFCIGYIF